MELTRENSQLIITNAESELQKLINLSTIPYHKKTIDGTITKFLECYEISDDQFITSMGFLHGIKKEFPDAEINIDEFPKLDFRLKKNFTLWREQTDPLMEWVKKDFRGTISSPTGSGKSILGMMGIFLLNVPTIIIVPTKELQRKTWVDNLTKKLRIHPRNIGFYDGENKDIRPVTIAIYDSMYININKDPRLKEFEFVMFDETHRVGSICLKEIALKMGSLYRVGLSATPARTDRNEEFIYRTVGDLIKGRTFEELKDAKRVSPVDHTYIYVNLLQREKEEYAKYFHMMQNAKNQSERMTFMSKTMQIALSSRSKIPKIIKIVLKHRGDKILIFTRFVAQAKEIQQALKIFNAKLLMGETHKIEREQAFDWFHKSDSAILVTTSVMDEGIDVPDATVAIIVSGFGTTRQLIQRRGRIGRYLPDKIARLYEIVTRGTMDEKLFERRNS